MTDDPTTDEKLAYFYVLAFLAGPFNQYPTDLSVTPAGYIGGKIEEWFGIDPEGTLR